MEPFKEKKIVGILEVLGVYCLFVFLLSLILTIFYPVFLLGILGLPIGAVFAILGSTLSNKNEFTYEFIKYIKAKIDLATNLIQLVEIKEEFENIAIKDNFYYLSYPVSLRNIHNKINNQIEILKKVKN